MQPVLPLGGVPLEVVRQEAQPVRAAAQVAAGRWCNILFTQCSPTARPQPPEQLWEIPEGEESKILLHCCL